MPIREDNRPNRRFGIINLVLIGFSVVVVKQLYPNQGMQQVQGAPTRCSSIR